MQDEKRRSKFNMFQRLESGFDTVYEGILNSANRYDERRRRRAKEKAKAEGRKAKGEGTK